MAEDSRAVAIAINSRFSVFVLPVGRRITLVGHCVMKFFFFPPIVSVAYQRVLPMDKDEGSLRSTCGVPKGIWSGFILAVLSGFS